MTYWKCKISMRSSGEAKLLCEAEDSCIFVRIVRDIYTKYKQAN